MAEIEFRLPSKVPYGYVNLTFTVDEQPTPEILGTMYANYVMAFTEAERAALDAYGKSSEAPSAPREPEVKETRTAEEIAHEEAVQAVSESLGATVVDEYHNPSGSMADMETDGPVDTLNQAPWEKQASAPQPKPWEKKSSPDKVAPKAAAVIDW